MSGNRPFVLSIAGLDPSGGAGILADVKTFEQNRTYGLAVMTANTIQTDSDFAGIQWIELDFVVKSVEKLLQSYPINAVKIGIVPSLDYLKTIVATIRKHSQEIPIVWDTVLKSTTDFSFLDISNKPDLTGVLSQLSLITPNRIEAEILFTQPFFENLPCPVLLKGGHREENKGQDLLFLNNKIYELEPAEGIYFSKHGSGCVLSSAIAAQLALGNSLFEACILAKRYTETFLSSNLTQIGYHYV